MATAYASPMTADPAFEVKNSSPKLVQSQGEKAVTFFGVSGSTQQMNSVNLGTLFDKRFQVFKAIPVVMERTGDGVAAIWQEIDEFGHAQSASIASVELAKTIAELYATLREEQANLGPDLKRVWRILNEHLRFISR